MTKPEYPDSTGTFCVWQCSSHHHWALILLFPQLLRALVQQLINWCKSVNSSIYFNNVFALINHETHMLLLDEDMIQLVCLSRCVAWLIVFQWCKTLRWDCTNANELNVLPFAGCLLLCMQVKHIEHFLSGLSILVPQSLFSIILTRNHFCLNLIVTWRCEDGLGLEDCNI